MIRLFNLQIVNGEVNKEKVDNNLVRAYPIKAPRGEILDRYGRPLVTNGTGYYVQIQSVDKENTNLNSSLINLISIFEEKGYEYVDEFPISGNPYAFDFGERTDSAKLIAEWKKANKFEAKATPDDIIEFYRKEYKLPANLEAEELRNIVAVRYTMDSKNFDAYNPYTFASDIDVEMVHIIKENSSLLSGVNVETEPVREYVNGSMAAHILGRTGIIYKEEYDKLKDRGYGMNDIIGKEGLEKVLEKYLKGKDGYKQVEQTKKGKVSQTFKVEPAKTDYYAVLTLDSELQKVLEKSLAENIEKTRGEKGTDCFSGAAVAVDIASGEVLAMASLPGFDPAEYTAHYNELLKDPQNPLFNRALSGAYTPGSTFKPLTSIAALEEGLITPTSTIVDQGVYKYYAPSYEPTCLIWKNTGETHGAINVSEAIGVSCNYFYYDVGRRLGIETIARYARNYGLGQPTGIELAESSGIVASPEYREKMNAEWYPGDTLQAAIGQSDNMFTPAQLASYVSTILNNGTRYSLHLVKDIRSYETGEAVYIYEPKVLSQTEVSQSTVDAVKDGMRRVTEDGTAKTVFEDFPVEVGGKTGTAEVGGGSDTVLFVGFAPYDKPQIAVAVVLEHGATSKYAAQVARDMFEYYLGIFEETNEADAVNTLLK
ncbi:MAG: penicillin-binding protein 2 [Clostridia bacterium]|nr:penicillin-binding protein 2 [Clostridia bacterium]